MCEYALFTRTLGLRGLGAAEKHHYRNQRGKRQDDLDLRPSCTSAAKAPSSEVQALRQSSSMPAAPGSFQSTSKKLFLAARQSVWQSDDNSETTKIQTLLWDQLAPAADTGMPGEAPTLQSWHASARVEKSNPREHCQMPRCVRSIIAGPAVPSSSCAKILTVLTVITALNTGNHVALYGRPLEPAAQRLASLRTNSAILRAKIKEAWGMVMSQARTCTLGIRSPPSIPNMLEHRVA